MPVSIVRYTDKTKFNADGKLDTSKYDSIEYVGILIPTISDYVIGRVNFVAFAQKHGPENQVMGCSTVKEVVMQELAMAALLSKTPGQEIHIVEYYHKKKAKPEDALVTDTFTKANYFNYMKDSASKFEVIYDGMLQERRVPLQSLFGASAALAAAPIAKESKEVKHDAESKKGLGM